MDSPRSAQLTSRFGGVCWTLSLISLFFSFAIGLSWIKDNASLRKQALAVVGRQTSRSASVVALNNWVYGNRGFAKNKESFLFSALGPTPVQIMRSGGDCADKSRLLSAMLFQIGISSGLVMIYPCPTCMPIHTVVEAEYENGRMVIDPIWDIDYPLLNGKYLGVADMAGTDLGRKRLIHLKEKIGPSGKIWSMPPSEATFDYARAINWDKNGDTRAATKLLRKLGIEPNSLFRPRMLEDPKLAIWLLSLWLSISVFSIGLVVEIRSRKRRRNSLGAQQRTG